LFFFGIRVSYRMWPAIIKLCRNVVAAQFNWSKSHYGLYADFISSNNSIDTRELLYLPDLMSKSAAYFALYIRQRHLPSRYSENNAREGETYRVNCERSEITQTRFDQPYRTSATLMLRYGTFLRGECIYKRKRFSLSLSLTVFLYGEQRCLNCKNKAFFIAVSSISQRIQITRLSELLLHGQ